MSTGLRGSTNDRSAAFLDGHGRTEGDEPNRLRVDERDREELIDLLNAEVCILPLQWRSPQNSRQTGEYALARAVFVQALLDLRGQPGNGVYAVDEVEAARVEAMRWLLAEDTTHIYSFVSLCDLLGLSPSAFRAGVLKRLGSSEGLRLPRASELNPVQTRRHDVTEKAA